MRFYREMHPYGMQRAAAGCASTKRCIPTGRVFKRYKIFLPEIELKKEVAKTSFLPNFPNKTTSVAGMYDANSNLITSLFARSIAQ
jgi:hypothetical protein